MNDWLGEYRRKRNFSETAEPCGAETPARRGGLRFVVQYHEARHAHFDFRLEWRGALISWAVPKGPSFRTDEKRLAVRVEDHPLEYRDFEGTIPQGEYGGGAVLIWDEGEYEPTVDFDKGLAVGSLKFRLFGSRMRGGWALVRMKGEEKNWLLVKERDEFAGDTSIVDDRTSIRSGRSVGDFLSHGMRQNPFSAAEPMLAAPRSEVPEGKEWIYETKFDGYRALAFLSERSVRLVGRRGSDLTARFLESVEALGRLQAALCRPAVFDGEIAVLDGNGRTDFSLLHRRGRTSGAVYFVFDLLADGGEDLRPLPLSDRKMRLADCLSALPDDCSGSIRLVEWTEGDGAARFEEAKKRGEEGIVCKRRDSEYVAGRSEAWVKVKCAKSGEFVVGGYYAGALGELGALYLGQYRGGDLAYCGKVGTGFSAKERESFIAALVGIGAENCPFEPPPRGEEDAHWLEPRLVAEVRFAERTRTGKLRHPVFRGFRIDKLPEEVLFDEDGE